MATSLSSHPGLFSAVTGVVLHILLFRHGEWDNSAPNIVAAYTVVYGILNFLKVAALWNVHYLLACHLSGLFCSIAVYRYLFHRLRKFPGPALAAITSFYADYLSARRMHKFAEIDRLHQQHGDYVRVGPRELSIANPQALNLIYGSGSQTTKGPFYDGAQPYISVHSTRDKKDHARRRKVWDRAFSAKGMWLPSHIKPVGLLDGPRMLN